MKDNPALICKQCEKMCKACADFKKKCIEADQARKTQSNERFIWVENLTELRKVQPVEDEVVTIETMGDPPRSDELINPPIIPEDTDSYDFIDNLTRDQLKEMTLEVSKLLENDFFESEQFQFIKAKVAKKSTTTVSATKYLQCLKCKAKFPDKSKLAFHRFNAHKIGRKNFGNGRKKKN